MPPPEVGQPGGAPRSVEDILLRDGTVIPEQIEAALQVQRGDPRDLGSILLSLGYVNKVDLARACAKRLHMSFVELNEETVDPNAAGLVDRKVLSRLNALPLYLEDGRLVVAMSDPTNLHAIEDLTMLSGHPVAPVVALEEDIRRVRDLVLGAGPAREATGVDVEVPVVRLVNSILQRAVDEGASDVHLEPRARRLEVRMRVDGVLREVMSVSLGLHSGIVARIKVLADLDIAERRMPQDGRFSLKAGSRKVDLRAATLPATFGEKVVLRLLDGTGIEANLEGLGFASEMLERYEDVFRRPYGTILVTGPTGSGKSTTLYATLGELNTPERNIITIEDPVEYRLEGITQIQVNTRIGLSFASCLRAVLRADPDVVMIGEIRDRETAKISVEAALTGHLVLATLHTNNAPAAVTRLTDMGVEPFLTASAVDCVIAQRLARRLCERCKQPVSAGEDALAGLPTPLRGLPDHRLHFHEAAGCDRCGGSGYRGRIGIFEVMILSTEIKKLLLRRASVDEIASAAEERGMVRLREDGLIKAAGGITTVEEVLRTTV